MFHKVKICLLLLFLCVPLHAAEVKSNLEIRGVTGKVSKNIEKRLHTLEQVKPLNSFSQEELNDHILKAIQPFGYFKARIHTRVQANKISVFIQVGAPIHISSIKVELLGEGARNPQLLKTVKKIPLQVGDILLTESYNKAKQNIQNCAEHLGYLHGNFSTAQILIDEQQNLARITLIFDTGPLFYFGQVQFDPTNINPDLLHRYVPFRYEQAYSTEQVLKLNNDLTSSGYFSSVVVKPQVTDAQHVPVIVHLQPVEKYTYSLGAGYGTDTGVRGRAALHVIPVNRKGHQFNAIAQGSFTQNALQAQYVVPGENPVTDQYALTSNFSNLNYNAGYSNGLLLSLAQQHNTEGFKRSLSLNGLFESFSYTLQPNSKQFMLYPKATFTFNKVENPLFSPSGYNLTLNGLAASQLVLSRINVAQFSADAKAAFMIKPMGLRLYGHTLQGFTATSSINQLPLSLALLLGGADNLKAYSFNSIGPGKTITYAGFELQQEFRKNWYITGFVDAGSVYNPTPREMLYDAGGGLMWVSPIGPIKVGLAQPINNRWQRSASNPRIVISLGPDL